MHELSIAKSIIESAEKICKHENLTEVKEITIEIGALSGVSKEALAFCWPHATAHSLLENSNLVINEIPLLIECHDCQKQTSPVSFTLYCESCGKNNVSIINGNELLIKNMEAI